MQIARPTVQPSLAGNTSHRDECGPTDQETTEGEALCPLLEDKTDDLIGQLSNHYKKQLIEIEKEMALGAYCEPVFRNIALDHEHREKCVNNLRKLQGSVPDLPYLSATVK